MANRDDILDEGTSRTQGVNALTSNIEAAKATAEIVRSTLGPMGMDKMLIDSYGNTIITNDGAKILQEVEVQHPGAKILVDIAKTQESEVGDGTTTAVLLCSELLTQAQDLIKKNIHPTHIIRGYREATKFALQTLQEIARPIKVSDETLIKDLTQVAMTGKVAEYSKDRLSEILTIIAKTLQEDNKINRENLKIQKIIGGETLESSLVEGLVLDKKKVHPSMPKSLSSVRAILLDTPLNIRETSIDTKININSIEEYRTYLASEDEYFRTLVFHLKELRVNTIFCQKDINETLAHYLAQEEIFAVKRVKKSDMEKLSSVLNSPILNSLETLSLKDIGFAKLISERIINKEHYIFVEAGEKSKALTLLLKASTIHFLNEIERALDDALGNIETILKSKTLVAGGGAIELELHKRIFEESKKLQGKDQIIFQAFAKSFLTIPQTLCDNCGLDSLEVMAELITLHERNHEFSGINSSEGIVKNTLQHKIIEPSLVKIQAIKAASESTAMILKIDDIIAAKKLDTKEEF